MSAKQKIRADESETQADGAIVWSARWLGGPSLARIDNCRLVNMQGDMRRTVYIKGEADTFFSIPAEINLAGCRVTGYVTSEECENGQGGWSRNLVFHHCNRSPSTPRGAAVLAYYMGCDNLTHLISVEVSGYGLSIPGTRRATLTLCCSTFHLRPCKNVSRESGRETGQAWRSDRSCEQVTAIASRGKARGRWLAILTWRQMSGNARRVDTPQHSQAR